MTTFYYILVVLDLIIRKNTLDTVSCKHKHIFL